MSQPIPESISHALPEAGSETAPHLDPYATRGEPPAPAVSPTGEAALSLPGYEVLEVLGRGGMGVVYRARQLALNRLVAVKMILTGAHASESEVSRFRAEAETIARLRHPHIVQIHEVGEIDGRLFCALELAEGGTLSQHLAGTPLRPREAAGLVEKLSGAVQAAHDASVIHRDLKPANVLLASRGRESPAVEEAGDSRPRLAVPKITDFGLAKRLDDESGQTQSGAIMGTPSYMAPEQASGLTHVVGPAADIYALGAILYECLTGRPPFRAANLLDTLEQVRSQEPVAPSRLQPTVPRDLETICLKCLAKEPARRYASAMALADDLRRYQSGEPIQARPVSTWERVWKWAKRRPVLAALAVALAATAVGLFILAGFLLVANEELKQQTQIAQEKSDLAAEQVIRLNVGTGARHLFAGDLLESLPSFVTAFHEERKRATSEDSPELELHRLRLGMVMRQCPRPIQMWTSEEPLLGAMFNVPGDRVMGFSRTNATVWDVHTGNRVGLYLSAKPLRRASLSPDGSRLALKDDTETIRILDVATGKLIHECHLGMLGDWKDTLEFSPDGKYLMAAVGQAIKVWDAQTGQLRPGSIEEPTPIQHARFSPDGSRLVSVGQHTVSVWNPSTSKKVWSFDAPNAEDAVISAKGNYLVVKMYNSARIWRLDTGAPVSNPVVPGYSVVLKLIALSPDEQHAVLVTASGPHSEVRSWELSLARPMFRPLTFEGEIVSIQFTPDGAGLAIVGRSGEVHLRNGVDFIPIIPPFRDDAADQRVIKDSQLTFNSDGRMMLLRGQSRLRLWDLASGLSRSVSLNPGAQLESPGFSGDGSKLATLWDLSRKRWFLELQDPSTGARLAHEMVSEADREPSLVVSRDGTRVAVWTPSQERYPGLDLWDFRSKKPVVVPIAKTREVHHAAFSEDGRRLGTVSADRKEKRVDLWDADTGKHISRISSPADTAVLSTDGRRVATTMWHSFEVRLWDGEGKEIAKPLTHSREVKALSFSPDGSLLATATETEVRVWNVADATPLTAPLSHAPTISHICFSPNGKILASISGDFQFQAARSEVRLWDVTTGTPLCSPLVFPSYLFNVLQFRRDGRLLLIGAPNGAWCLLDPATGEPVSPLLNTPAKYNFGPAFVRSVAFSPDEREVRAFSDQRSILRAWDLTPLDWHPSRLDLMSSLLGRQRPGPDGKITPATPEQQVRDWKTLRADTPPGWLPAKNEELAWRKQAASLAILYQQHTVALQHLDAILAAVPDDKWERLRRAKCCGSLERWDDALADMTQLMRRHSEDAEVWRQRGNLYAARRQWDRAEKDYSEAIQRDPNNGTVWNERGLARVHQEHWAAAASDFGRALESENARTDWWLHRVMALVGQKDEKTGRAACVAAWNTFTSGGMHPPFDSLQLAILFHNEGLNPQAVLEEALATWRKDSRKVNENVLYGAALMRAGEYDKAAERLEAVLRIPKGEWLVPAGYFLAVTRARQGKQPEARKAYDEAVRQHELFLKDQKGQPRMQWTWQMYVQQLRTEAESLLKGK